MLSQTCGGVGASRGQDALAPQAASTPHALRLDGVDMPFPSRPSGDGGGTRVPREDPHRYGRTHTLRRVPRRVPQMGPRPGIFPLSSALNEMTVFEDLLFAEDPGVGLGVEAPGARPAGAGLWPRGLGCTAGGDVASCWQG